MFPIIKNGQTSVILTVKLRKLSTGLGYTGLSSSSSGLIIGTRADNEASVTAYTQAGSTIETITTLGTYAAPTATKCRFKEVDATNAPGDYEIHLADARFAVSNAKRLRIAISGVSDLDEFAEDVVLTVADLNAALATPTNITAGTITTATNVTTVNGLANNVITAASIDADAIGASELAADAVAEIQSGLSTLTLAQVKTALGLIKSGTCRSGVDNSSNSIALPASTTDLEAYGGCIIRVTGGTGANQARKIDSVTGGGGATPKAIVKPDLAVTTDDTSTIEIYSSDGVLVVALTDILIDEVPFNGADVPAIKAKTDNLPSDPADASVIAAAFAGLNDISAADVLAQVNSALTTAVADSIPADGSRPSPAQALYMLVQFMMERSVSGTTVTVKKPDGSTTLLTLTLDDATNPTSTTRAS